MGLAWVRAAAIAALGLLGACSADTLDPSPPLATTGGGEADNPLLDEPPLSCEERKTAAEEHVLAEVAGATEGCTTGADCVMVDPETHCFDSCPLPVAAHAETRVREAAADADMRWCHRFAMDCRELVDPGPACSIEPVRCEGGRCVTGPEE